MQSELKEIISGFKSFLELQPKALLAPFGEKAPLPPPPKIEPKVQPQKVYVAPPKKAAQSVKPEKKVAPLPLSKTEEKREIAPQQDRISRIISENPEVAWRFERKKRSDESLFILSESEDPFLLKVKEALLERGVKTEIKAKLAGEEKPTLLLIPASWKSHPDYSFHERGALYRGIPTIALEETSLYERDPLLKRALWQALKTALHLS